MPLLKILQSFLMLAALSICVVNAQSTTLIETTMSLAEEGNAKAQANLGAMYTNGFGVAKDDVLAYAWFNIAATIGNTKNAPVYRDKLETVMPPEQVAEARRLSSNWRVGTIIKRETKK